jgi:hypothetical protein
LLISMRVALTRKVPSISFCLIWADAPSHSVPIYDGRSKLGKPFTFSNQDFADLPTWPLYKKGNRDLPTDSVVAVGYTMNTYTTDRVAKALSSNVQFAILLAVPAAEL